MNKTNTPSIEQMQEDLIEEQVSEFKEVRRAYIALKHIYEDINPKILKDIETARVQSEEAKKRIHCYGINGLIKQIVKDQIKAANTQYELAIKRHNYITHTLDLLSRCSTVKGFFGINRYFIK